MRTNTRIGFHAYCLLALSFAMSGVVRAEGPSIDTDLAACKPIDNAPLNDYRKRDSMKWNVEDVKKNHYDPAMERMSSGEYSRRVLEDIKFILNWYPNHYPALEALITYDLAGGKFYEYNNTACYLERARQFAPDDTNVLLREGYYFWKRHDMVRARSAYEEVLRLQPNSPDANYNLGLLYVEMSEFQLAVKYARAAYSAGYPLPGLKRKLQKAGYWKEAETFAAP